MVNWGSGEVGEDNRSESPGVVRRGAMAPHWPSNRVYLFPVTSEVLRPGRIWYTLPNWQWVVPTSHMSRNSIPLAFMSLDPPPSSLAPLYSPQKFKMGPSP